MRERTFQKLNEERWKKFESYLDGRERTNPDLLANLFIQLTDDLSYARTFYPESKTVNYLNGLALKVHQKIYRNKKEKSNRFIQFWKYEVPFAAYECRKQILYSFLIFSIAALIGILSLSRDESFARLILGDGYVNMTLENIKNGDPMGVYKQSPSEFMFLYIAYNNIYVMTKTFIMGILLSFGTAFALFQNGMMLGVFQFFFYQKGMFLESAASIWIHGALEISAIIIAGGAGLAMGNSILFPGTYSRLYSLRQGAMRGLKLMMGLIPIIITAAILESYVTRHTEMPAWLSLFIILSSFAFIGWYFIIYPGKLIKKLNIN